MRKQGTVYMGFDLEYLKHAKQLSEQMLTAVAEDDIRKLTKFNEEYEVIMTDINSKLASLDSLSENEIEILTDILAANNSLINKITRERTELAQQLIKLHVGKKMHNKYQQQN